MSVHQESSDHCNAALRPVSGAHSARSGAFASEASSNLDLSTPSGKTGPRYSCTLLDFGDVVECRAVYISDALVRTRKTTRERLERITSCYQDPDKLAWRTRRAQRMCRWRCLALRTDALWTLTKRGKFETAEECNDVLRKWIDRIEYWTGEKLKYVAVPEQHADGRWHIHMAVSGYREVGLLRRLWYKSLGGTGMEKGADAPGSLNMRAFKGKKCTSKVARYISKYMSKAFTVLGKNKLSFWASKGLNALQVVRWSEPVIINRSPLIEVRKKVEAYRRDQYQAFEWNFAGTNGFIIKTSGS